MQPSPRNGQPWSDQGLAAHCLWKLDWNPAGSRQQHPQPLVNTLAAAPIYELCVATRTEASIDLRPVLLFGYLIIAIQRVTVQAQQEDCKNKKEIEARRSG